MYQKTSVSEKSHIRQETDKENTGNGISLPAVTPVQKAAEEELPAQGKFETVQKAEEEEPMQGKFKTVQKAAEEELPAQGKFEPVQKAEEEEPMQGKFKTVQKAAEEELPAQGKFETVQKAEEEEPMQGKFKTVQKAAPDEQEGGGAEEEEAIQGKFKTVQKAAPDEQEGGGAEEEEAIQGKFKTVQKAAEEELPAQGKFETVQKAEEEEPLQGKFTTLQKKKSQAQPFQLKADTPNNTGLPNNLKSGVESLSGFAMDDVKVHYNSDKPKGLQAHAYAQGTDIHIGPGQEQHLPHEAWHVAQQKQGRVQPTMQMKQGVPVNDDAGLENEADVMGAKAVTQGKEMEPGTAQLRFNTNLLTGSIQRKANTGKEKTHPRTTPATAQFNRGRSSSVTEETSEAKFQRENAGIIGVISNASSILGEVNWGTLASGSTTSTADTVGSGASGVGVGGSLTGLSGTATNSIQGTGQPDVAGAAGDIVSGVGSSIGSLVKTVIAIKDIYKAANGSESKLVGTGKIAIGLMAALKSGCEAAMSIQKFVNGTVPPGVKSLIPGLGLAIAACEVIVNVYTMYNAYSAESEMAGVSGEFKTGLAAILHGEPHLTAPSLFANEVRGKMFNRITYLRLKPGLFETLEQLMDTGLTTEQRTQRTANFKRTHNLASNPVPIAELCAAIRYYELGSKMQEINQKRKVQGARNIFANLLAIAGEIAKFFPADGGITATVLLGTSAAIGAAQSAAKFIQGFARDRGILGADQNRSGAQKQKEYVNHTRTLYQYMGSIDPATEEKKPKVTRAEQMLRATGVNTSAVYATEYDNATSKTGQVKQIIEAMKTGR